MEEKVKIIDEIVKFHPSFGTEKGWSCYTGGMKDTGSWYFRKMLNAPIEELTEFLTELESRKRNSENAIQCGDVIEFDVEGIKMWISKSELEQMREHKNAIESKHFGFPFNDRQMLIDYHKKYDKQNRK